MTNTEKGHAALVDFLKESDWELKDYADSVPKGFYQATWENVSTTVLVKVSNQIDWVSGGTLNQSIADGAPLFARARYPHVPEVVIFIVPCSENPKPKWADWALFFVETKTAEELFRKHIDGIMERPKKDGTKRTASGPLRDWVGTETKPNDWGPDLAPKWRQYEGNLRPLYKNELLRQALEALDDHYLPRIQKLKTWKTEASQDLIDVETFIILATVTLDDLTSLIAPPITNYRFHKHPESRKFVKALNALQVELPDVVCSKSLETFIFFMSANFHLYQHHFEEYILFKKGLAKPNSVDFRRFLSIHSCGPNAQLLQLIVKIYDEEDPLASFQQVEFWLEELSKLIESLTKADSGPNIPKIGFNWTELKYSWHAIHPKGSPAREVLGIAQHFTASGLLYSDWRCRAVHSSYALRNILDIDQFWTQSGIVLHHDKLSFTAQYFIEAIESAHQSISQKIAESGVVTHEFMSLNYHFMYMVDHEKELFKL